MRLTEINQLAPGTPVVLADGTQCRYETISFEEDGPTVIVTFAGGEGSLLSSDRLVRLDDNPPVWETSTVVDGLTRTVHVHHGYALEGPHGAVTFSPRFRWGHTHQLAKDDDPQVAPTCRTMHGPCAHYRMTDKTVRNVIRAWESAGGSEEAMFRVLHNEWSPLLTDPD